MSEPYRCPACGRELVFAVSLAGKNLPLERVPGRPLYTIIAPDGTPQAEPLEIKVYQNHYGTCSEPERFRARDRSLDPR